MDFKTLAENLGLEESEFFEMTDLFVEVSISDLDRLKDGLRQGDSEAVVAAAHSIKGAAANLGFNEIFEITQAVEMNARDKNLDGADAAVEKTKEKLDQLVQYSAAYKSSD